MFDISWQELLLICVVALLVIPPKDLPRALATAGRWMRRAKMLARDVHNGIDELAREAELAELRRHAREAADKVSAPITIDQIAKEPERTISPAAPPVPPAEPGAHE
jgi:sec-independent protein translocase protein TatB